MDPVFRTPRLTARKPKLADANEIHEIYSDPEVTRYLGGTAKDRSLDQTRQHLEMIIERDAQTPAQGYWVLQSNDDDSLIGAVLLKQLGDRNENEVGYHIRRSDWGKGYATEAAKGAVRHGFEVVGLTRIVAVALAENVASLNVMRKIGFRREGTVFVYGYDLEYYSANELPAECRD